MTKSNGKKNGKKNGNGHKAMRPNINKKGNKVQRLPCMALGCKNTSAGPRFHYLCDSHREKKPTEKQLLQWKKPWLERIRDIKRKRESRSRA